MINFSQIQEILSGSVPVRGSRWATQQIQNVMACSLMSDVLVTEDDDILLMTSLASDQAARTADMVGACGIVLFNGKTPQEDLIQLCSELDLTLITSPLSSFEAIWKVGNLLYGKS